MRPERFGSAPSTALAFAILGSAWLFYAWPWISGAVTVPWDAKNHFYPMLRFLASSLASGQSPDWSPYHYAGHPMIADPQSLIFSLPYRLLAEFVAVPTFRHQDAIELLTVLAGGLGLVLFFRERGWGTIPGIFAAMVFAFGGPASARLQHIGQILSYAAIPFALWAAERLIRRRSIGSGLLLGLTGALLAVGRDQVALLGCFLVAGWLVVGLLTRAGPPLKLVAPLTLGGAFAGALLLVPLGLTIAFAAMSNRPEITFFNASLGSLHPAAFLSAVVPDLFDSRGFWANYWGPGSPSWWSSWIWLDRALVELHSGTLPVVLFVAVGVIGGRVFAPGARVFLAALVLFAIYAVGRFTPGFGLFYDYIPGVALYRRPADATFHMVLCMAILSGYALHRIATDPRRAFGLTPLAVSLAAFTGLFVLAATLAASTDKLAATMPTLIRGAILVLAAHGLIWFIARADRLRAVAVLGALAFAATDLAVFNTASGLNSEPPEVYAELDPLRSDPLADYIKRTLASEKTEDHRNRAIIFGISGPWQNAPVAHGIEAALGYNPLRWGPYQATVARSDNAHFASHPFSPLFPSFRSPLPNMLGLSLFVSPVPIEQVDRTLRPGDMHLAAIVGKAYIYDNRNVFPRVFFADGSVQANFDVMIGSGRWPDVDLRRTVVLDTPQPGKPPLTTVADGQPRTAIVSYKNTEVIVEVETPRDGFVVLNDVWNPWWRAEVDGQPAPLLRANVLFRAVPVTQGKHRIRFSFHPVRGLLEQIWPAADGGLRPPHLPPGA